MAYTLFFGSAVVASSLSLKWIKREAVFFHSRWDRKKPFILPSGPDHA